MKISLSTKIITVLAIVILAILYFWHKSSVKLGEINKMYVVAQDTIKSYRNAKGEYVSTISVLQASKNSYFLQVKTKDSAINHLQDIVRQQEKDKHDLNVALTFYTTTNMHLHDSIKNLIVASDTQTIHGVKYVYPTYTHAIKDSGNWATGNVLLGRSTFDFQLKMRNDYDIVIGTEPDGWFKRKPFAMVTDHNIYTTTQNLKVYQKTTEPNKPLLNFIKGGIVGAAIILILHAL